MVSQSTACNAIHALEPRLAGWLLQSHNRVRLEELLLAQEYLAAMPGVHGPPASIAAGILQCAGIIESHAITSVYLTGIAWKTLRVHAIGSSASTLSVLWESILTATSR